MVDMKLVIKLVGGVLLLTIIVVAFIVYREKTTLILKSVVPANRSEASVTTRIEYTFNHPLDPDISENFSITPYVPGRIIIKDDRLIFEPSQNLDIDTEYEAVLENPRSKNGLRSESVKTEFTAVYIPFNEVPEAQREQEVQQSENLQETYPIVSHLPHETLEYKIDYTVPNYAAPETEEGQEIADDSVQPLELEIELYAIRNRPEQHDRYKKQLRRYRDKALEYIRSLGFDPNDYDIRYNPDPSQ